MVEGQPEERFRATRECEAMMQEHCVPDFVQEVHRRKFRWAGQVARRQDGRWTREVLTWSLDGKRPRKRPLTRWTHSLQKFASTLHGDESFGSNECWMALAQDEDVWRSLETDYINFVAGNLEV